MHWRSKYALKARLTKSFLGQQRGLFLDFNNRRGYQQTTDSDSGGMFDAQCFATTPSSSTGGNNSDFEAAVSAGKVSWRTSTIGNPRKKVCKHTCAPFLRSKFLGTIWLNRYLLFHLPPLQYSRREPGLRHRHPAQPEPQFRRHS